MSNISDVIEKFINEMFIAGSEATISRNELADYFSCAPSQINYVLSTRFSVDKGYAIVSKRGNGGYVTIIKVDPQNAEDAVLDRLDQGVSEAKAAAIISRLVENGSLTQREGDLINICLSSKNLTATGGFESKVRGKILKAVINELLKDE